MAVKTLITEADLDKLPTRDDVCYEVDEGELVTVTLPTPRHNLVVGEIFLILREFVRRSGLGEVFPSDTPYIYSIHPQ